MKKNVLTLLAAACLFSSAAFAYSGSWTPVQTSKVPALGEQKLFPERQLNYRLDDASMKAMLFSLGQDANAAQPIELPTPDGGTRTFMVWSVR